MEEYDRIYCWTWSRYWYKGKTAVAVSQYVGAENYQVSEMLME